MFPTLVRSGHGICRDLKEGREGGSVAGLYTQMFLCANLQNCAIFTRHLQWSWLELSGRYESSPLTSHQMLCLWTPLRNFCRHSPWPPLPPPDLRLVAALLHATHIQHAIVHYPQLAPIRCSICLFLLLLLILIIIIFVMCFIISIILIT